MENPKVIFRSSDHSYWYGTGPIEDRKRLTSVNRMWTSYFEPFDTEMGLSRGALALMLGHSKFWSGYFRHKPEIASHDELLEKYSRYINPIFWELRETVKFEWNYGNVKGTALHDYFENKAYEDGYVVNPFDKKKYETRKIEKKFDNQSIVDDLWDLEDGCYPELVVWNDVACGQVDQPMIETIDGVRYFDIIDFKSNGGVDRETGEKKRKEIFKASKQSLGDKKYKMGKGILSHMYDCGKYTAYQGQLSMYARLLEEAGYIARNLGVAHYLEYNPGTEAVIKYPYLEKETAAVMEDQRKRSSK